MTKYGVNIDLSIFFEDERKRVLIMVDPKWENVECLQNRVQYLFEVDTVRFINSDGSFVPPQEPIEIIKFCKGLKAFVPTDALEKRKKSKKNKKEKFLQGSESEETSNSICNNESNNDESQKKRKYSSEIGFSTSSTPNQAKRIKSINLHKNDQINKSSEISSTSEQMPPPSTTTTSYSAVTNKKSKASSVTSDYEEPSIEKTLNTCELLSQECTTQIGGENTSNIVNNNKRLTSTPKEKKSEIAKNLDVTFNDNLNPHPSSVPSSTFIDESKMLPPNIKFTQSLQSANNKNPFKKQSSNKSKGHIYFNESGDMVNTISSSKNTTKNEKENKAPQSAIFRCSLNDIRSNDLQKPRIFNIKPISKKRKIKQVVEIQEEIILSPKSIEINLSKSQTLETTECQVTDCSEIKTSEILQNSKTDSLHATDQDKNSPNNTTNTEHSVAANISEHQTSTKNLIITENSATEANNADKTSMENLETTQSIVEAPVTQVDSMLKKTDTKAAADQTSLLSIESVDLSIDDDEEDLKTKKKQSQSKQQSHDLTYDDRNNDSSDIEEISEIIDLNETDDNCNSTVNTTSSTQSFNYSKIVVHKILPYCTDLLELPSIGDIIVFKVPYVNKKQKSAETNFMAGKAEYINRRTKSIKIVIVDGFAELSNVPNKFLCNLNESQDQTRHLQLKLNEMLEPKIFSRS